MHILKGAIGLSVQDHELSIMGKASLEQFGRGRLIGAERFDGVD